MGISTPIVTGVPGTASPWEAEAGPDELAAIVRLADELGFDHVTCSEHVAVPEAEAGRRGATYWDPLATLAFAAAHSRRVRLVTSVLVLPYHQPLAVAKRYGTLDRLSGGRLVLGVGVGSLEEEFALLDAPWADRGAVTDERLQALREAWGRSSYDGWTISPTSPRTSVPIWVGGRTARSLRRAVELGDGWMPFGLGARELRALLEAQDLPPGFDVVLATGRPLDPAGDPTGARAALDRLQAVGATVLTCALSATGVDHYGEQLRALATLTDES